MARGSRIDRLLLNPECGEHLPPHPWGLVDLLLELLAGFIDQNGERQLPMRFQKPPLAGPQLTWPRAANSQTRCLGFRGSLGTCLALVAEPPLQAWPGCDRRQPAEPPEVAVRRQCPASVNFRHGVKISFAAENDAPGLGPPAITYIFPATTALPSPWRAVGIGVYSLQVSLGGA